MRCCVRTLFFVLRCVKKIIITLNYTDFQSLCCCIQAEGNHDYPVGPIKSSSSCWNQRFRITNGLLQRITRLFVYLTEYFNFLLYCGSTFLDYLQQICLMIPSPSLCKTTWHMKVQVFWYVTRRTMPTDLSIQQRHCLKFKSKWCVLCLAH